MLRICSRIFDFPKIEVAEEQSHSTVVSRGVWAQFHSPDWKLLTLTILKTIIKTVLRLVRRCKMSEIFGLFRLYVQIYSFFGDIRNIWAFQTLRPDLLFSFGDVRNISIFLTLRPDLLFWRRCQEISGLLGLCVQASSKKKQPDFCSAASFFLKWSTAESYPVCMLWRS